jgi:hypothetical protein
MTRALQSRAGGDLPQCHALFVCVIIGIDLSVLGHAQSAFHIDQEVDPCRR